MEQRPKLRFSIVIPAYNEAHYIADTLDSLNKQHFNGDYEVIVVDNNCTDQTATIARSLGAKVFEESHPGVCWARQRGTEEAKGEIIISGDADTIYPASWLARVDEKFQNDDKIVAVAGACRYVNSPFWGHIYTFFLFGFANLAYLITGQTYYASATNIAFRKSAWIGYNTTLTQGGDELDLLRNLRKKGRIVFDWHNPTKTSSRRLVRGFIYNFIVSFLIYYILEYNLNRLFKRPVLGSAPKFRNEFSPKILTLFHVLLTVFIIAIFALYTRPGHILVSSTNRFIRTNRFILDTKEDVLRLRRR